MVAMDMVVVRNGEVLDAQVGTETVLMSVESGQYYALTATSRDIWHRLQSPTIVRDLCRSLAETYKMPLATVEADTLAFLEYLAAQKMLEIRAA